MFLRMTMVDTLCLESLCLSVTSSQLRLYHERSFLELWQTLRTFALLLGANRHVHSIGMRVLLGSLVTSEDLQTAEMGVLAVLVVLKDADLKDETAEQRSLAPVNGVKVLIVVLLDRTDLREVDRDPTARLLKLHVGKFDKIVKASAGPELHAGRCVTLVVFKVEEDADVGDGDLLEEVHGEEVGLRTVTLPEERGRWVAEGSNTAAGLAGADGPGGQRRDLLQSARWQRITIR
jgi:hypothetical protein